MKKFLIFGGLGFIGKHLTNLLISKDHTVIVFDLRNPTNDELNFYDSLNNITFVKGNILNNEELKNIFDKYHFECVFHLASFVGIKNYISDPSGVIITNINGTNNIANLCIKHNTHLFFTSTSEVLGKNIDIPWDENSNRVYGSSEIERWSYGSSKGVAEQLLIGLTKTKGLSCTISRFFNVYGEGQNPIFIISKSIHNCLNNIRPFLYDDGKQTRCFTYVKDATDALYLLMKKKSQGIFHIGSNFEYTIEEVIKKIIKVTKFKNSYISINTSDLYQGKYEDILRRVPNVYKIQKEIGWKASTTIDDGILKIVNWANNNKWWLNLDSSIEEYKPSHKFGLKRKL